MTDQREQDIIESFISFADRLIDDVDVLDLTTELTRSCARLLDIAAVGLLLADAVISGSANHVSCSVQGSPNSTLNQTSVS